jgi:hypothetical protein
MFSIAEIKFLDQNTKPRKLDDFYDNQHGRCTNSKKTGANLVSQLEGKFEKPVTSHTFTTE